MKIFIKDMLSPFSTKLEKEWKVSQKILIKSQTNNHELGIILKFHLNSLTHDRRLFDLDNIVEYVFSVLINEKGFFTERGKYSGWYATKILSQT